MQIEIRKLGNSAGVIIPSTLLRALNLSVGCAVNAEKVDGGLMLTPASKPRYSLKDLLSKCNAQAPAPTDMKEWDIDPVGKEIV